MILQYLFVGSSVFSIITLHALGKQYRYLAHVSEIYVKFIPNGIVDAINCVHTDTQAPLRCTHTRLHGTTYTHNTYIVIHFTQIYHVLQLLRTSTVCCGLKAADAGTNGVSRQWLPGVSRQWLPATSVSSLSGSLPGSVVRGQNVPGYYTQLVPQSSRQRCRFQLLFRTFFHVLSLRSGFHAFVPSFSC